VTAAPVDVGRLLDEGRWGAYQKWLVFLTALTIVFDGIDNQLLGVSIPSIMREWGVGRSAFAPVVALGFFGMMIGGAAAGLAGDRFGRRFALLATVVLFGVATLAAATAGSVTALAILRLIAGVGLGGAMPNAAALAAEYVPARQRPIAVTITIVCVPLGATLAGLLAIPLLPAIGWRGVFVLGGIAPLAAAAALAFVLPESPRYLVRHRQRWPQLRSVLGRMGHPVGADAVFAEAAAGAPPRTPIRAIVSPGWRVDTFALWGAFVSCLFAVYLGFSWLPTIFADAGLSPAAASSAITGWNLGGVAGALCGGVLMTRFGSRVTMLAMTAGAIAGAIILSRMAIDAASVTSVIAMLTITGGLINAVQTTMYALAAHVYPTAMRATGVGVAVAIGRGGAIASGYGGPMALDRGGASFFLVMAAALVVTFVSLATVRRHVR
jgi:AAHS family 4-hydroxybenzoate transporter-like MFS transporter